MIFAVAHQTHFRTRRASDIGSGGVIGETGTIGMFDGGQILRHYRAITNKVVAWVRNIVAHCIGIMSL